MLCIKLWVSCVHSRVRERCRGVPPVACFPASARRIRGAPSLSTVALGNAVDKLFGHRPEQRRACVVARGWFFVQRSEAPVQGIAEQLADAGLAQR